MKINSKLIILLLFFVSLALLSPKPHPVRAQWPQDQCIQSFFSEYESPCANCCNNPTVQINAIDTTDNTSPGYKSAFLSSYDCGGSSDCQGYNCGSANYYEARDDPTCCSQSGMQCTNDSACCTNLKCDTTVQQCTGCVPDGDAAQSASDCCTYTLDPNTGLCGSSSDCNNCFDDTNCEPCGEVCDDSTGACASCVSTGDIAESQWDCCSGQADYDNGYWCE